MPLPPSTYGALAGATVLANLSASNITVGKADFRRTLVHGAVGAHDRGLHLHRRGPGRVDDRPRVGRPGDDLRERRPASPRPSASATTSSCCSPTSTSTGSPPTARARTASATRSHDHRERLERFRRVAASSSARARADRRCGARSSASRTCRPTPRRRDERCYEVYNIQVHGLETRLRATGIEKVVIGVSGGLDSTHALIVVARAMDRLGLPRENVLAYTMPGFATSDHTKGNAWKLMEALGVTAREIDIRPSRGADARATSSTRTREGEKRYDITFENVQAGERTLAPVPARQPPRRARDRHRRPVASSRSGWARTASATRCRTTRSTPPCPRR